MRFAPALILGTSVAILSTSASAASTFESASLGATGQTQGIGITTFWVGARFELDEDTTVTSLGAHVTDGQPPGTVFLALFQVEDASSFPACGTTECALHTELYEPPSASADVVLPVEVPVSAGHYIVVAGTYSEGAMGTARLPRTNTPVEGVQWVTRNGSNGNYAWATADPEFDLEPARLTVTYAACGDGELDVGEDCDDGNADDTDACVEGCVPAECGDGFVQTGIEECDDGNRDDDDACSNACTLPVGGSSSGGGSSGGDETTGGSTSGTGGSTSGDPSTSGAETTTGDEATSSGTTDAAMTAAGEASTSDASGGSSDTEGAADGGGGGCSIGGSRSSWLLLGLLAFAARRRSQPGAA